MMDLLGKSAPEGPAPFQNSHRYTDVIKQLIEISGWIQYLRMLKGYLHRFVALQDALIQLFP